MFYKSSKITTNQVTQELIAKWKRKYPEGVFEIEVADKKAFIRMPSIIEVKSITKIITKMAPLEVALYFLKKAWLAGDDEIVNDDCYQMAALDQLGNIMKPKIQRVLPKLAHLLN